MKVKLLTTISFFTYQLSISQTEKLVHGKVIFNNNPLNKVEVINKTAKTSTRTNDLGEFSILVRAKDSLLFFSKDYFFKRLKLTQEEIDQNNILVNMITKPEELDEVVVTAIKFDKIKISQHDIDTIKFTKDVSSLQKYTGVYNGTITNGMDFTRIGTGLLNLFKNDKEGLKKKTSQTDFKKLIAASIPSDFFTRDLKLKPEEKELFIEFCDADPRSKTILEHNNVLTTMDFLYAKNEMFKKLKAETKN
ncbi:hypothetical protein D0809_02705 [Flavobacterium circumlabens]|uniref:Carboxypeptidase-like regulatory domain-containing protein n=1 Tax=Flavobacterium circumlabens TaxID=2133765 RepID=A0A4Y7UJC6_9FLAO|nr:hypothetical protein [Flavobacterium circumlabens]TCN60792.1 hypothetical protein EV142_101368 [Flavobacterium circumlabens]TEB45929.1 hypothetical protein D0809_02705 [Flavobacterium circumlabens]